MHLPMLIGISGKRKFDADDAGQDRAIAKEIAAKFKTIFEQLDRDFPETPKIVLTGAAFGADLIAYQVAYDMGVRSWAVAAILPFSEALFKEDFEPAAGETLGDGWEARYREHAATFEGLLSLARKQDPAHPRLIVRELPRLKRGNLALTEQQLTRRANADPALRRDHYEQVGQFIAESATIMIAVTRADEPADGKKATGGTNRVVAYRRAGHADEVGAAVARNSTVLRKDRREPIAPPARFVWLLDPSDRATTFGPKEYPVQLLAPMTSHSITDNYAHATCLDPDDVGTPPPRVMEDCESLVLARAFRTYNDAKPGPPVANVTSVAPKELTAVLGRVAREISQTQMAVNQLSRRAFWAIAILFVAAIFLLETYAKFFTTSWLALGLYLAALVFIGAILWTARWMKWQPKAEDYRAVAEMMRVQRAWWSAGLTNRVDREHLQGASTDLVPVREAATAIIAWLVLRCGWRDIPPSDWTPVRGRLDDPRHIPIPHEMPRPIFITWLSGAWRKLRRRKPEPRPPSHADWVGGQLSYFARNAAEREDKVHITDAASWTLFIASGFIGSIIWALLVFEDAAHHHNALYDGLNAIAKLVHGCIGSLPGAAAWGLLALLPVYWRVRMRRTKRWKGLIRHFIAGALTAILICLALMSLAPELAAYFKNKPDEHTAAKYAMIVLLVGLSAIAGAWRYLTERLNIEAEAHEYHDAHRRFDRAEHLLAGESAKGRLDDGRAGEIVLELGRLALAENAAWLKSRRERPLTPVVG
jgi:hypothetical protein